MTKTMNAALSRNLHQFDPHAQSTIWSAHPFGWWIMETTPYWKALDLLHHADKSASSAERASTSKAQRRPLDPEHLMKKQRLRRAGSAPGFTLIELLIVVALISILVAIAVPSYTGYVNKQRMRAAQADLVVLAADVENAFQRTLAYPATTATTAATQSALTSWRASDVTFFTFVISASSSVAFTVQAVGKGALSGCTISLTQANVRTTSGCPQGAGAWL